MSTRAYIGIRKAESDEIRFIYMHNGHPCDIGERLLSDYNTADAVENLIDGGDLSSFGKDGIAGVRDYYKDREGEDWELIRPGKQPNRDVLATAAGPNYIEYIFVFDNGWEVACARAGEAFDYMPLKEAMQKLEQEKCG